MIRPGSGHDQSCVTWHSTILRSRQPHHTHSGIAGDAATHPHPAHQPPLRPWPEQQLQLQQRAPPPRAAAAVDATTDIGEYDVESTAKAINVPTPEVYPSAKTLLKFALPTLILPLADPIMSLIDTVCIGNFGTVVELAALGPASLLFGAASSLFSALTATALSDISARLAQGDNEAAAQTFGEALQAAAVAGTAVIIGYGLFATQVRFRSGGLSFVARAGGSCWLYPVGHECLVPVCLQLLFWHQGLFLHL